MHKERLLKLATHLQTGALGHKVFDFRRLNDNVIDGVVNRSPHACGTNGCALGECPIVFPDDWKFGIYGPQLIRSAGRNAFHDARVFFDISISEAMRLFSPTDMLGPKATREEVAAHILAFVADEERTGR